MDSAAAMALYRFESSRDELAFPKFDVTTLAYSVLNADKAAVIGFPTGMRLASAIDVRPTPWFWAVNGAAGVFASGLSVGIGTFVSVDATLWSGAAAYLLLLPVAASIGAVGSAKVHAQVVAGLAKDAMQTVTRAQTY